MNKTNIKFNFEKPTQNVGEDFLIIEGTATTNAVDSDGKEIIITYKAFQDYIASNSTIDTDVDHSYFYNIKTGESFVPSDRLFDPFQHRYQNLKYKDRIVGNVLELDSNAKDIKIEDLDLENLPKVEVKCKCKITDQEAIEDIKNGNLTGFSLLWNGQPLLSIDGKIKVYLKLDYVMLTLTKNPKNDDCNDLSISNEQKKADKNTVEFKGKLQRIQNMVVAQVPLAIGVETEAGQERHGSVLACSYGHIRNYIGEDKMALDCYIGNNLESQNVYKVFQVDPNTGKFDESKFMLGFDNIIDARKAYLQAKPFNIFNGIVESSIDEITGKAKTVEAKSELMLKLQPFEFKKNSKENPNILKLPKINFS
jgi:Inorganic Pyrophosphatase